MISWNVLWLWLIKDRVQHRNIQGYPKLPCLRSRHRNRYLLVSKVQRHNKKTTYPTITRQRLVCFLLFQNCNFRKGWKESGFAPFDCTYPYTLLHCEIARNDKNIDEPILESKLDSLIGSLKIIWKFRFYSMAHTSLKLAKSVKKTMKILNYKGLGSE